LKNCIYVIPCTLSSNENLSVIPPEVAPAAMACDAFIVEDLRSARRYLRKIGFTKNFDELPFFEMTKGADQTNLSVFIKKNIESVNIGILSEAGCPGVADPGADAVKIAHNNNIEVRPLVGPSSIILTLMASGFNGQNFAFNGYMPIEKSERGKRIATLENLMYQYNQTQLFIETPFRNNHLFAHILEVCKPTTKLCIASELTLPEQFIATKTIAQWKTIPIDLHKKMVVFALYK
jgi:16S rRNA (cytidine1402-2'-O)-methyltransferase